MMFIVFPVSLTQPKKDVGRKHHTATLLVNWYFCFFLRRVCGVFVQKERRDLLAHGLRRHTRRCMRRARCVWQRESIAHRRITWLGCNNLDGRRTSGRSYKEKCIRRQKKRASRGYIEHLQTCIAQVYVQVQRFVDRRHAWLLASNRPIRLPLDCVGFVRGSGTVGTSACA